RIREVQGAAGQPLVEEPDPARVATGRGSPHESLELRRGNHPRECIERRQVHAFPFDRELQLSGERIVGAMAWGEEKPVVCRFGMVSLRHGGQAWRQGEWQTIPVYERGVADGDSRLGKWSTVKKSH